MVSEKKLDKVIVKERLNKEKRSELLKHTIQSLRLKQEELKDIKPTSGFSAGWFMGAYDAYETCISLLDEKEREL